MSSNSFSPLGAFSRGKKSATGGTAFAQFIPPYRPTSGAPVGAGAANDALVAPGIIHVTDLFYIVPTTAHLITWMRPLNYTTFSADAAASQAAVALTKDPGAWGTAGTYSRPLPNGQTVPSTASNLIGASDYVMYQAAAGQWVMDTVASGSGTTPTLTTNLPTGGVKKGGLFYFFGISSDTDPATNEAHPAFDILAAGSNTANYTAQSQAGPYSSLFQTLYPGDPLIVYSSNATAAGFIELLAGYYARH